MKVFLDLDGVLCDFIGGVNAFFGVDYHYTFYPYELGKWDIFDDIGGGVGFDAVNAICTETFWANLKWMFDGRSLYNLVMGHFNDTTLLTTPMPNPGSWSGKFRWIKEHLGPHMAKKCIITTASKDIVAGPDSLLIDDRDKNVDEFRAAGGHAILVNRPWNRGYELRHKTYECLDKEIRAFEREIL